ncbi:unnamed protein product, partial [Bubo scandiacus]
KFRSLNNLNLLLMGVLNISWLQSIVGILSFVSFDKYCTGLYATSLTKLYIDNSALAGFF